MTELREVELRNLLIRTLNAAEATMESAQVAFDGCSFDYLLQLLDE
jgi:hypothetical protein